MKNIIAMAVVVVFSVSGVLAQNSKGLKGPAAKNYKPWKDKNKTEITVVVKERQDLQGPSAKNNKVWKSKGEDLEVYAVEFDKRRKGLEGPEAKNYKPWAHSIKDFEESDIADN